MTEHVKESAIRGADLQFPPSWMDRLIAWIDRLPGPAWLIYVLSTLAYMFLAHVIFWVDGSVQFGAVDPLLVSTAVLQFYWVALYHYLTRVGSRSLKAFRPLLEVDDFELARIDYELATLPRRLGWLAIPIGLGFGAIVVFGEPEPFEEIVPRTALPYVADTLITAFLVATFFCVLTRSVRQLRTVGKLHGQVTSVNLLKLDPAHAFSALTARTGIGIILLLIVAYVTEAASLTTVDMLTYAATAILSIAVFVLPVIGMRDHLEAEKQRKLDQASDLLRIASDTLHAKIEVGDYDNLGGMETAIRSLIRERELLASVSTWPWDLRTIRGFVSALLLPIVLWLVTRLLERFL